jgi:hypothetical protein
MLHDGFTDDGTLLHSDTGCEIDLHDKNPFDALIPKGTEKSIEKRV